MRELDVFPLPGGTYWKSSPFGWRTHPVTGVRTLHRGVDYAASSGTPVFSPFNGLLTKGYESGGAGNWANISNGPDLFKSFHHSKTTHPGGWVKSGDLIGYIGTTGSSTGPHAHLELWENNHVIDPTGYFDRAPLKGSTPNPPNPEFPTTPVEDEEVTVMCGGTDGRLFACNGLLKRHLSGPEASALAYIGVKNIGTNDTFLSCLTEIPRGMIAGG